MMSEHILLSSGEALGPIGDGDPAGAMMGFLTKGRLKIQMDGEEDDCLMLLPAGNVIPEATLASFGSHLQADVPSEIYRVSRHVFEAAVAVDKAAQKWIWLFRMKE